jgi:hypothetical protein
MLIKCPECQKEISDAAASCPHCGKGIKRPPIKVSADIGVFIILLLLLICGIIFWQVILNNPPVKP